MSSVPMVTSTVLIIDERKKMLHFTITEEETNLSITGRIRALSTTDSASAWGLFMRTMYILAMRKLAVGKGRIFQVITITIVASVSSYLTLSHQSRDIEGQIATAQQIYRIKKDQALTALVFGPESPIAAGGNLYAYLVDGLDDAHRGYREVWCLYYAPNGTLSSVWMVIALTVALTVGLAVGFGTGDGKLGMGVGGGVLGVLMCIHGAALLSTMP